MTLSAEQQMQVDTLKRKLGDAVEDYTDDMLWILIDSGETLNSIASTIWGEYAASKATLINMAEGSSKRNLGDLHVQATKMSLYFKGLDAIIDTSIGTTRTARITRP